MVKIVLIRDPETGRALYADESKVLGIFDSLEEADKHLGDLLRHCNIVAANLGSLE